MKLQLVTFPSAAARPLVHTEIRPRTGGRWLSGLATLLGSGLALAAALVLPAWAIGMGLHDAMAALSWMAGIAFLALAVDNTGPRAVGQVATGLALMALGWMCSRLAPEFGVIAAWLTAGWLLEAFVSRSRN